jgi:hypothetical protein
MLYQLLNNRNERSSVLRLAVLKVIGTIGALDPHRSVLNICEIFLYWMQCETAKN